MPIGASGILGIIEGPWNTKKRLPQGPVDDWKWPEGRPPSHGSPLIPKLYHPWHKQKWAGDPIIPPRLGFQGVDSVTGKNKAYTMPVVVNNPTYISAHHIISLRKMLEQLWAPKFYAHIHLQLEGEIYVKPLYAIEHGAFKAADYYQYLGNLGPTYGPFYVFSVGGFYSNRNGHLHYWNAGASGYNTWKAKIHFDHGGSINEQLGNYTILKVEYNYVLTKFYRRVFSQDGDNIWGGYDYNAHVRQLHLPIYDSFDGQWLTGFAMDSGDYWSTDSNTDPATTPEGLPYRIPKYDLVSTIGPLGYKISYYQARNIIMSSCKLPQREEGIDSWFCNSGGTLDNIEPYNIQITHPEHLQRATNRFIQLSVYSPEVTKSVGIAEAIKYFQTEVSPGWTEGREFEVRVQEEDKREVPEEIRETSSSSAYVTSLIGSRLVPYFRVTVRDLNGNVHQHLVTDTELYGVDKIQAGYTPANVQPVNPDTFYSVCDGL